MLQNPEVVSLKEDIKRTGRKLKLWEQELEQRNKTQAHQHSKVAKLKEDLEKVSAGKTAAVVHVILEQQCSTCYDPHSKHETKSVSTGHAVR